MSLRFNQVFVGLLALSFLSAFFLPARVTNPLRGVQGLFAPVSWPARKVGGAIARRFAPPPRDVRDTSQLVADNQRLQAEVLSLSGLLEEQRKINKEREGLGPIRPLCTPFNVVATDPGPRQSISIDASTRDDVREGMPVVSANALVGLVDRVGVNGAQVKLATDAEFRVQGRFFRYLEKGDTYFQPLESTPPLVKGMGKGILSVMNIPIKETGLSDDPEKLKVNVSDVVAVDDPDWPRQMSRQIIGRIESIQPQRSAPQFAEIRIVPIINLTSLYEVMVMNKTSTRNLPSAQP